MPEPKFIEEFLSRIKKIHESWENGDLKNSKIKTADIINKDLKIAIEIKTDSRDYDSVEFGINTIRNQLQRFASGAAHKFRMYPGYSTILLIRIEQKDIIEAIRSIFPGSSKIKEMGSNYIIFEEIKDKCLSPKLKEIGAYLFYGNNDLFYLENPVADKSRVIKIEEARKHLNIKLKVFKINSSSGRLS